MSIDFQVMERCEDLQYGSLGFFVLNVIVAVAWGIRIRVMVVDGEMLPKSAFAL